MVVATDAAFVRPRSGPLCHNWRPIQKLSYESPMAITLKFSAGRASHFIAFTRGQHIA